MTVPSKAIAFGGLLLAAVVAYGVVGQPWVAHWGSTAAERTAQWPGDDFVPDPSFVWTNAITIDRPADQVWPWPVQWGQSVAPVRLRLAAERDRLFRQDRSDPAPPPAADGPCCAARRRAPREPGANEAVGVAA